MLQNWGNLMSDGNNVLIKIFGSAKEKYDIKLQMLLVDFRYMCSFYLHTTDHAHFHLDIYY